MGRYITLNSQFNPFSFDDYIKPYQIYGEAYKEMENQYDDLSSKATILENLANSAIDQREYQQYKSFADDLRGQANQLATQGLSPSLKRELMTMRNRYKQDISPMETAYQRRAALAEEQRLAMQKDPTLFYERMASEMGLSNFLNNPNANYGKSYSGALLTSQVAEQAKNLIKQIKSNPTEWKPILENQYYEAFIQKGFTDEDVYKAISGDSDANPILVGIVDKVIQSSGIENWMTPEQLKQAKGIASQGLYNAVGSGDFERLKNEAYETPYEKWKHQKEMGILNSPVDTLLPAYYQWIGNELTSDDNLLKKYNQELNDLNAYFDNSESQKDLRVIDNTYGGWSYMVPSTESRLSISYKNLQDKYRTQEEKDAGKELSKEELETRIKREKSKALKSTKSASFNNAQSAQAMRYLGKELDNIWNNPNITNRTRKQLIKNRRTDDGIDDEIYNKLKADGNATIQFNPYSDEFIINSTDAGGSFVIDKSILANIQVPIPNYDGTVFTMPMDKVFEAIHELYQNPNIDIDDPNITTQVNNFLRLAFGAFNNVINSGEFETTKTSASANTSLNNKPKSKSSTIK